MNFDYNDENLEPCIEYKKNSSENYSKTVSLLRKNWKFCYRCKGYKSENR